MSAVPKKGAMKKVIKVKEKVINGTYDYYPLSWFDEPFENDLGVQRPPFQRVPNKTRIDEIKNGLLENEVITQIGVLSIVVYKGIRYIIDGQHRLSAYKELQEPAIVMVQFWIVHSLPDMKKLFLDINNVVPIENYIIDSADEVKLAYDKLITYIEKEYRTFIKGPTSTGKNNFPHISSQTFRRIVPYIEELKNTSQDNIINKFEEYNLACRSNLIKKKDKDIVCKLELSCKSMNHKPLYINRDIMRLWTKHAADIKD